MSTKVLLCSDLYEEDFYVWTEHQAALLRARRFDELDLENLIEEVEDLGKSEKSKVLSNALIVMEHLLKLEHSPADDPKNKWRETIRTRRNHLHLDMTPRLRSILVTELPQLYGRARRNAAGALRDHGEHEADALPETCPYDLERILGDWLP